MKSIYWIAGGVTAVLLWQYLTAPNPATTTFARATRALGLPLSNGGTLGLSGGASGTTASGTFGVSGNGNRWASGTYGLPGSIAAANIVGAQDYSTVGQASTLPDGTTQGTFGQIV